MALTTDTHVETMEEGGGRETRPEAESIDIFFELLAEAQLYMKEMQRHAGRLGFVTTKLTDRMNDWLDMKEQEASDGRQALPQVSSPVQKVGRGYDSRGQHARVDKSTQSNLDFVEAATLEEASAEKEEDEQ